MMRSLALIALLLTLPAALPAQDAADLPDFNGIWKLDPARSDDLGAVVRRAVGDDDRPGSGRGTGPGGRRHPGEDEPMPGDRKKQDREDMIRRAEQAQLEYARLEIFQKGEEFDVTNGLEITQVFHTDGSPVIVWTDSGAIQATARWVDKALVMEFLPGDDGPGNGRNKGKSDKGERPRPAHTRRFQLSPDGQTMTIVEERPLPGSGQMVKLRLVYQREP